MSDKEMAPGAAAEAKDTTVTGLDSGVNTAPEVEAPGPGNFDLPSGWMYKKFRIAGSEVWYASPKVQLLVVSMVCFLCPGMFNALSGLGAGGLENDTAQAQANTALYSTFAVVGFFSGTFANRLGIKLTMAIGGLGYCVYSASFLCYVHTKNIGFVIFAGALLGVCAGLLWCGQGAIMMSYPPESHKGRYISWFWIIFNLGAVVGSFIPLGQNINNYTGGVTDGTYVGFIVLMLVGALLALFLCNSGSVIRDDGTKVIGMKNPSWLSEFKGLWSVLIEEPWIVALFPMFFASNIFYTYQLNNMNGAMFNVRTRSLNSLLYWIAQIIGAIIFGYALDFPGVRRSIRARVSLGALTALTFIIWGGGWAFQSKQPSRAVVSSEAHRKIDWTDGGEAYIGPMFLFMAYGFFDAIWQTSIYWYMGALSNSGRKAANLAGFYKGIQSAGAAVFWRLDSLGVEFNTIFGATVSSLMLLDTCSISLSIQSLIIIRRSGVFLPPASSSQLRSFGSRSRTRLTSTLT